MILPDFMNGNSTWPVPHRLWKFYKYDFRYRWTALIGFQLPSELRWAVWDYTYYQKMWMAAWPVTNER